jgi:hypothetical protein
MRIAWYRFRAALGRRWGGYLSLVLLIGSVGGLAMGSVAGARRTQSSYPAYLASTNPSDLDVGFESNTASSGVAGLENQLAHLSYVKHVANYFELLVGPVRSNGTIDSSSAFVTGSTQAIGSANGLFFKQDRVTVVEGRMANPARENEFVTDSETARLAGWHLNETIPFGAFTLAQAATGASTIKAHLRFAAKLVGIVVFNDRAVVHDDVDHFVSYALFTPTLTRSLIASASFWPFVVYGLQLDHGSHDLAAVEREIIGLIPRGSEYNFYVPSVIEAEVQRAIKPETIALGVFGAIAALATLLIASQAIGRQLRANDDDLDVLRALGATPTMAMADGLIGVLGAVIVGSFLAASVAVGLSPLAPIGAVREVDPSPGIAFDWDVLSVGVAVLIIGLGVLALALAYWRSPDRITRQRRRIGGSGSRIVRAAMSSGLAAPAVVGLGFAVDPGRGRTAVPVRSALFGTALAVLMVVATLTFGSSLQTLVSHPALYGWNWSYAFEQTSGGNVPPQVRALLNHSPDVAGWTGFSFASAQIDGQTVPILAGSVHAELTPGLPA